MAVHGSVVAGSAGTTSAAPARAEGGAPCAAAHIVARFAAHGEAGLLDLRSERGRRKVDADVLAGIARIIEQRAPEHGFARPTSPMRADPVVAGSGEAI